MKLFVLAAVLCSTFVVAFGAEDHTSEEEAIKFCNSSYPVTEDPRQKLAKILITGAAIPKGNTFYNTEYCHLYCFLEKVGFFNAEGKMDVRDTYNYILKTHPEVAPNSHILLVHLFQIGRSSNGIENKCMKAIVAYYRFIEAVMVANLATDLNTKTDIKEKVVKAVQNGEPLPKELEANIEKFFKDVTLRYRKSEKSSANISSTAAPVPVV